MLHLRQKQQPHISFINSISKGNDFMVATRTGSKQLLRDLNRSIVFNLLFSEGPISRAELARKSNLTAPAITQIIGDFVTSGLVIERPADSVSVGRRPVMLEINVGAGTSLASMPRSRMKPSSSSSAT